MAKFKYEIEIEERNQFEADLKIQAATTLLKKIPTALIDRMAFIAKNEPEKIEWLRKFLAV